MRPGVFDATSVLYLGFRHPSASLPTWQALTLGRPAALEELPGAAPVACELARLQGCEAATLVTSTLHLFWDLFGVLSRKGATVYMDSASYPIIGWGAARGAALGAPSFMFPSGDVTALERLLERTTRRDGPPVIVSDGWRPGTDRQPPIQRYAALAARYAGYLVLDDTQALGIFGHGRGAAAPYGRGGGGSLQRTGLSGPHIVVGASLAKAFGVPMAVLSGGRALVQLFEAESETRVHSSPPSAAAIAAARHALTLNRQMGDALRARLWELVQRFRQRLARARLWSTGGDFPVQSLAIANVDPVHLHRALLERRVRTVLHRGRSAGRGALSFIINVTHSFLCIDRAIEVLVQTLQTLSQRRRSVPLQETA